MTLLTSGTHHGGTSMLRGQRPFVDDLIAVTAIVVTGSVLAKRASRWARTHDEGPRDVIETKSRQLSSAASAAADAWRRAGDAGSPAPSATSRVPPPA